MRKRILFLTILSILSILPLIFYIGTKKSKPYIHDEFLVKTFGAQWSSMKSKYYSYLTFDCDRNQNLHKSNQTKNLLVGILTTASKPEKRALIRSTFMNSSFPKDMVHIRFVICKSSSPEYNFLVSKEIEVFNDILYLDDCIENMDNGKTFHFLSHIGNLGNSSIDNPKSNLKKKYNYVMKMDDDVFLHVPNLFEKIQTFPENDLYYGRNVNGYMGGAGYILSWDLVQYVTFDPFPRKHIVGNEDQVVSYWLFMGNKGLNAISDCGDSIYDSPFYKAGWARQYTKSTILVHKLKNSTWFLNTARHFM